MMWKHFAFNLGMRMTVEKKVGLIDILEGIRPSDVLIGNTVETRIE